MTITTGIKSLDRILAGALRPGNLVVAAGVSASGMTTLLDTIAVAAGIEGKTATLLFDVETSREARAKRILSASTGIPLVDIQQGVTTGLDQARIAAAQATMNASRLSLSHGLSLGRVQSDAELSRAELVLVDGCRLLDYNVDRDADHELAVLSSLKEMARDRNMLVVATSPLNRVQPYGRRPTLSDLSAGADQAADAVVLLHRDESAGSFVAARSAVVELNVVKNRFGDVGACEAIARFTHARMFDLPHAGHKAA
jgi:replicative DNA helicase